tara:strand:+ start:49917 stop:50936 length:1020 start_codon:yes stop_codon:yes gene_type:complete
MKILYGVQGTGHGHINRAKALIPILRKHVEVDVLLSGYNFNIDLDGEVKFKKRGISLTYDSKGSVDLVDTALNLNPVRLIKDIKSIQNETYDFTITDFEPISAWASRLYGIPCIGLSHQASFFSEKTPRPEIRSNFAEYIIKNFAPCDHYLGTHYKRYDHFIEPPILREEVINLSPKKGNHITVYLPAFSHEVLVEKFKLVPEVEWHLFSPSCNALITDVNVRVFPVGKTSFLDSLENSLGLISSAGFEGPSEAMYLKKKILVIPIKNQYEQLCNAEAITKLGGEVVLQIEDDFPDILRNWVNKGKRMELNEVCDVEMLVQKILKIGSEVSPTYKRKSA